MYGDRKVNVVISFQIEPILEIRPNTAKVLRGPKGDFEELESSSLFSLVSLQASCSYYGVVLVCVEP